MHITELFSKLRHNNIDLSLEGDNLRISSDDPNLSEEIVSEIRTNKDSIVAYLRKVLNSSESIQRIEKAPIANDYPLSKAQQRMWLMCQFQEINLAYTINGTYQLKGDVNQNALKHSFEHLIKRHEILRTNFVMNEQGEICQKIADETTVCFTLDYRDIERESDQHHYIVRLFGEMAAKPFQLATDALMRATLIKCSNDKYVLIFFMHHIISDGWSVGVLMHELLTCYSAYTKDTTPLFPELEIQYKDYAFWQTQQLDESSMVSAKKYWLDRFTGEIPVLELPTDFARSAHQTFNGKKHKEVLDAEIVVRLKELALKCNATLYMVLTASLKLFFYKYTGQTDIVIGSPIAGRELPSLEQQIGLYLNTLALRTTFEETDTFQELLKKVRETTLGAFSHQYYPFDELVSELAFKRDPSRNPLFDVLVVLQNTQLFGIDSGAETEEIVVSEYPVQEEISKFDLSFIFEETMGQLVLTLEYNSDLFGTQFIEKSAHYFKHLLANLSDNVDQSVRDITLLDASEVNDQLHLFNPAASLYPDNKTLVQLFEEQAANQPDKVALIFGTEHLTFRDLNARANAFAHYLSTERASVEGDYIAVKLERSEKLIVSLLAVLKTGSAYIPIDPDFPQERIDFMLTDAAPRLVINEQLYQHFLESESTFNTSNPRISITPDSRVYLMYTSGSTGNPKGCMLNHRGIVNRLDWMWKQYGYTTDDVILQKTTFTFDVSVWEIFLPLCWGAKMILCNKNNIASPYQIATLIRDHKVTCVHFVPSVLHYFIDEILEQEQEGIDLSSLEKVMTSGEALSPALVDRWFKKQRIPIHNLYGPTEASIDVTYYTLTEPMDKIPIGKPIANTRVYILNNHLQLLPSGCVGEIHLGGIGLAEGYLNLPELTAEKFIPDPFSEGEILYKTGDFGKWMPDGSVEYIGRKDDQVKIHGFRIELAEIEKAIHSYGGVVSAIALAQKEPNGDAYLSAYLVTTKEFKIEGMRNYLKDRLPEFMIPNQFIKVESIPLTGNGKLDKRALLALNGGASLQVKYVPPVTQTEKSLTALWNDLLGDKKIGIHHDFFEVGGHSLKAMRLLSAIFRTFNVQLELTDLFANPTIEKMAKKIDQIHWLKQDISSENEIRI